MIKIGSAMVEYAEQLERERGIAKEIILDSLKEAMVAAYKRYAKLPDMDGLSCKLIERTGEIGIYEHKKVVSEIIEPPEPEEPEVELDENGEPVLISPVAEATALEASETAEGTEPAEATEEEEEAEPVEKPLAVRHQILLADARKIKADIELDDILEIEVTPSEFGRIAAQSAKQVIMQRIREAEKGIILKDFEEKKGTVVPAIVQRVEGRNVIVSIGRSEATLPGREQLRGEHYRVGAKLRVYVQDVKDTGRVPQVIVSQAHPSLVREVFELEVPEIEDGLVEIKAIAREAGFRTKVAVNSPDNQVDPQGACIGSRGSRIQAIVNELRNEKIDIIRYSEDPIEFIVNALAPAQIADVKVDPNPEFKRALVIVHDDQLSLAIGREGQNVRLAAKLTGFKLDIKSVSQFEQLRQQLLARKQARAEGLTGDALMAATELSEDLQAEAHLPEASLHDVMEAVHEAHEAPETEETALGHDPLEALALESQIEGDLESELEPQLGA